ncbi:MAG: PAAR-like protein [Chryseobacterium jejuense]|uniref:PAAR-like protein n=1 Tax=Chryseobacterium jejuense TaxID=445960 RepID=UPI003D11F7B1
MDRVNNDGDNTAPETVPDNEQQRADNRRKMEDKRAEDAEKEKAEAGLKVVIDTATLECTLCTNPKGIMVVNYNTPTIQEKKTATVKEKGPKSLVFTGNCLKSPNAALPCASVMKVGEWKKIGTYLSQDQLVLLQQSTIPCNYGQIDIKITDSGQVHQPDSIEAKGAPVPDPKDDNKCFCEKEFTEDDIKSFYNSKKLFTAKNCPLPENMKSYKEFTIALNKAMKDNNINSCLRKAHFLAQIEAETRLDTTLEYDDGWDYDQSTHIENYNKYLLFKKDKIKYKENGTAQIQRGYNRYLECLKRENNVKGDGPKYKGRGLIQLTWKDTYKAYFLKINKPATEDPDIVANDLGHVCNSAGWYWREQSAWGDLNKFADNDDFISAAVGVNGGLTGFKHRKENLKRILKNMKVKENCKNQKIKDLGVYKYETSAIKNSNWGKKDKIKKSIQQYDD